ncbi:MAG TPA: ribosome small subunit-dependent GTPase A, partial [Planctomycetia bacterium]|nr:ribosome small subunit-dependent GTPase A [Planctomycetia bacterium]
MKKRKIRVDFQKNHQTQRRQGDLTREFRESSEELEDREKSVERVRAKGDLSRKRTIVVDDDQKIAVDDADCHRGRVLSVQGLYCTVVDDQGGSHRCYIRRLLKSFGGDDRGVATVGDWVRFKPAPAGEGLVVRIEPRTRTLFRRYRKREQAVAANVDHVLIVATLAQPELKLPLVDRYLVRAEQCGLTPIICFNKADLVDLDQYRPVFALYEKLGYAALPTAATTGFGMPELRARLAGTETVVVGQSGVGKSSLLNALEPRFALAVREVSDASNKGRHTTTTSRLFALEGGGTVIDTPGVRQFDLSEIDAAELVGYFREFPPYLPHCKFADCLHREQDRG